MNRDVQGCYRIGRDDAVSEAKKGLKRRAPGSCGTPRQGGWPGFLLSAEACFLGAGAGRRYILGLRLRRNFAKSNRGSEGFVNGDSRVEPVLGIPVAPSTLLPEHVMTADPENRSAKRGHPWD